MNGTQDEWIVITLVMIALVVVAGLAIHFTLDDIDGYETKDEDR